MPGILTPPRRIDPNARIMRRFFSQCGGDPDHRAGVFLVGSRHANEAETRVYTLFRHSSENNPPTRSLIEFFCFTMFKEFDMEYSSMNRIIPIIARTLGRSDARTAM
jgi:hypothetical protein